jgi:hypothetical protein
MSQKRPRGDYQARFLKLLFQPESLAARNIASVAAEIGRVLPPLRRKLRPEWAFEPGGLETYRGYYMAKFRCKPGKRRLLREKIRRDISIPEDMRRELLASNWRIEFHPLAYAWLDTRDALDETNRQLQRLAAGASGRVTRKEAEALALAAFELGAYFAELAGYAAVRSKTAKNPARKWARDAAASLPIAKRRPRAVWDAMRKLGVDGLRFTGPRKAPGGERSMRTERMRWPKNRYGGLGRMTFVNFEKHLPKWLRGSPAQSGEPQSSSDSKASLPQ